MKIPEGFAPILSCNKVVLINLAKVSSITDIGNGRCLILYPNRTFRKGRFLTATEYRRRINEH